ncbi:Copper resistance D [Hyphomicrobium sp. GJ21]|jgi:putative copper resistance protein D|uniref:copper homeostasis membrane protein CopD n=1 Tax=Hyphomicrobium sp. GJ21 TaxID=113574 RepID=UPI000622BD9A|nr:copper homeostasis membrane protein CopD [Hyphomicrobium sp. GJ21]CEJ84275.1 Copper resistance D [Hyphomicrobium sp. GJ21]
MMLEAGLILSRFVHYVAVSALFGIALFPLYSSPVELSGRLTSWRGRVLLTVAIVCLLTGILWLAFTTANMSGDLRAAIDTTTLLTVMQATGFGHLWILRLVLAAVAVAVAAASLGSEIYRNDIVLLLVAGALLATLAGTGHTQSEEGVRALIHAVADASHLLAAGAWLGGLIMLGFVLNTSLPRIDVILRRFSSMGYVAVAALLATGLVNTWFLVGSVSRLTTTAYGQLLILKLCLFIAMLILAAANRFWLVPILINHDRDSSLSIMRLRRNVLGEQVLGALVLLIVSILGTIEPAISQ